jgi:hypothetical protein
MNRTNAMHMPAVSGGLLVCLLTLSQTCLGSNLANPAGMLSAGRISLGASYHLGGYTITNEELGCIMNRFHARVDYGPLQYLNFGIDLGVSQMDVESTTVFSSDADTVGTHYISFQGKYGFSGGVHLKAATPRFFNDMMAVFGMASATIFTSTNDEDAYYSGIDGAGVVGLQFRVPKFGFISAGAKLYYIHGTNKGYNTDTETDYSNTDNIQGWLALDFLPPVKATAKGMPYFSAEITLVPGVKMGGDAVPIQGISFSLGIGWISPRLYGEDFENVE